MWIQVTFFFTLNERAFKLIGKVFVQVSMSLMTRSAFRPSITTLPLHKKGDNIVIMGSSPQHVVDTFCTFGLQIEEAETETKAEKVIVTTSQKSVTVVESTFQPFIFWILSFLPTLTAKFNTRPFHSVHHNQ